MATVTVTASCSSSWLALTLPSKMTALSLSSSLSFCRSISPNVCSSFQSLTLSTSHSQRSRSVVCEAAPKGKADSAAKRARQAEKRRLYNKSRKSQIRTRMKKVLEELDGLKKKSDAKPEEILPIEKLIGEAFSVIDKAVKVGTLHRNTGARRKSRLSRCKKAVEVHHGWYTPTPAPTA